MVHVIPENDLKEHEISTMCWCEPAVDFEGKGLVKHSSADGREKEEIRTGQGVKGKQWRVTDFSD